MNCKTLAMQMQRTPIFLYVNTHAPFATALVLLVLLLCHMPLHAQVFTVVSAEGTVKRQPSGKKSWTDVVNAEEIANNDIIETQFDSRVRLEFGNRNLVILGPNSKALVNIREEPSLGQNGMKVSLTLFAGGIATKAITSASVDLYTTNAVAELSGGFLSAIFEPKRGETGFQVLGGAAEARNIAQQTGKRLSSGQTTIVQPGREPTAPLYITHKHARVLKHFFGDQFISQEFATSNITPTDDGGATKLKMSENIGGPAQQNGVPLDYGMYKKVFNLESIYASILSDEMKAVKIFRSPRPQSPLFADNKLIVGTGVNFGIGGGGSHPLIRVHTGYQFTGGGIGLRLSVGSNAEGEFVLPAFAGGSGGLADLVEYIHFTTSDDSTFAFIAENLYPFTLGDGILFDRLDIQNHQLQQKPLGVLAQFRPRPYTKIIAFATSVMPLGPSGVYYLFDAGHLIFNAGYAFDPGQAAFYPPAAYRYIAPADSLEISPPTPVHTAEISVGTDVIYTPQLKVRVLIESATRLLHGNGGVIAKVPNISIGVAGMRFGGGFIVENSRLTLPLYHSFYGTSRLNLIESADTTFAVSLLDVLSRKRSTHGVHLFYEINPVKGLMIGLDYKQTIAAMNVFDSTAFAPIIQKDTTISLDSRPNFSYRLTVRADETFIPKIHYAELCVEQIHGLLYPAGGSIFQSWGTRVDLNLQTKPLVASMALYLGGLFSYVDFDNDFAINAQGPTDNLIEIEAGLRMGLM